MNVRCDISDSTLTPGIQCRLQLCTWHVSTHSLHTEGRVPVTSVFQQEKETLGREVIGYLSQCIVQMAELWELEPSLLCFRVKICRRPRWQTVLIPTSEKISHSKHNLWGFSCLQVSTGREHHSVREYGHSSLGLAGQGGQGDCEGSENQGINHKHR